jgi:predicted AlkP superfamily pyrophosphatase or phosphodiesterase
MIQFFNTFFTITKHFYYTIALKYITMMKHLIPAFLSIVLLLACTRQEEKPYLVVFSLDGMRYNQPDSAHTPTLDKIAGQGVRAKGMTPVFPTSTFTNHYSIATGLYPENSKLAHNYFYNSRLGRAYSMRDTNTVRDSAFYGGIPIWNHLQEFGIKTAVNYWIGSEAPINGKYANIWKKYAERVSFENRLDSVLHWLALPEENRPRFIMCYFNEPDHSGHIHGPFGKKTYDVIQNLDSLLGYFMQELSKLDIAGQVNVIVLSDHGMADVDSAKNRYIEKKIAEKYIERMEGSSQSAYIYPKTGMKDSLIAYMEQFEHIHAIERKDFPDNWHLNDTAIVPNLIFLADEGYNILVEGKMPRTGGCHGYDNALESMQAIFYAYGPAFKTNHQQPLFENVDLYPLICNIYKVEPPYVDGQLDRVQGMLKTR